MKRQFLKRGLNKLLLAAGELLGVLYGDANLCGWRRVC